MTFSNYVSEFAKSMNNGSTRIEALKSCGIKLLEDEESQSNSLYNYAKDKKMLNDSVTELEANNKISKDYVLEVLLEIADDKEEKASDRIKAVELIGKSMGIFIDKKEESSKVITVSVNE